MKVTNMDQENRQEATVTPPVAQKLPQVLILHGDQRVDKYFWMRDRNDPEVIAHLSRKRLHLCHDAAYRSAANHSL